MTRDLCIRAQDGRREEIKIDNGDEILRAVHAMGLIESASLKEYRVRCCVPSGTDIVKKTTGDIVAHVNVIIVHTGQYAHYGEVVS